MVEEKVIYSPNPKVNLEILEILNGRELTDDFTGLSDEEAIEIMKLQAQVDEETARHYVAVCRRNGRTDVIESDAFDDMITLQDLEEPRLKRDAA
jgi:hypothetical protein